MHLILTDEEKQQLALAGFRILLLGHELLHVFEDLAVDTDYDVISVKGGDCSKDAWFYFWGTVHFEGETMYLVPRTIIFLGEKRYVPPRFSVPIRSMMNNVTS